MMHIDDVQRAYDAYTLMKYVGNLLSGPKRLLVQLRETGDPHKEKDLIPVVTTRLEAKQRELADLLREMGVDVP